MLLLDVSKIPLEGTDIDTAFTGAEAHVEGENMLKFESGRLRVHVDRDEDATVHVKGHLGVRLGLECGRCLEPITFDVDQGLDLFLLPHSESAAEGEEDEVELSERDLVVAYYRGDRLDLGEVVREQVLLSVPMKHLCQPDCRGLCPSCGANRNRTTCGCVDEAADSRLAPLKKLLE
jgi:uncharacterized protein